MQKNISQKSESRLFTLTLVILGIMALLAVFQENREVETGVGWLIIVSGILEIVHGFRRSSTDQRHLAWKSAAVSILMGIFLINAPLFLDSALAILVAAILLADVFNYVRYALKETDPFEKKKDWLAAGGNILVLFCSGVFRCDISFRRNERL